ncbi:hypothetical protein [Modicisalibacter luteus]|uniref:hypothetical protein n=1 Tax=Modicisalibacter luteus TaxID=453962 RepID=UPI0036323ABD
MSATPRPGGEHRQPREPRWPGDGQLCGHVAPDDTPITLMVSGSMFSTGSGAGLVEGSASTVAGRATRNEAATTASAFTLG